MAIDGCNCSSCEAERINNLNKISSKPSVADVDKLNWRNANKDQGFNSVNEYRGFEAQVKIEFGMSIKLIHEILNDYELTSPESGGQWSRRIVDRLKARQKEINMAHEKKKLTRKEAIAKVADAMLWNKESAASLVDFYIEAGMLEIVEEEKPKLDWSKPLKLETYEGTKKVLYLNLNMKNERVVQIQGNQHQAYFVPNQDGYVVEYDAWISN